MRAILQGGSVEFLILSLSKDEEFGPSAFSSEVETGSREENA
jgi:hypothetical protein